LREIRETQAEALGRLGERLDDVLGRLADTDRRLDTLLATPVDTATRNRLVAEKEARNRLRDEAARLVQHLIIQREAIGLTRHAAVLDRYPVPTRAVTP